MNKGDSMSKEKRNIVVIPATPVPKQESPPSVIVPAPRGGPAHRDPSFIP